MQILQWELLFYIFIGGVGMFKLIKQFGYRENTALLGAAAYLCCGFITDNGSFIPWITCSAYLPYLFLFFYRLLRQPEFTDSIKLSLAFFLLLSAGYPSYLIYALYILFLVLICWIIKRYKERKAILKTLQFLFCSAVIAAILSLPLLLSFSDFFDYYRRGDGASLVQSLEDPFNLFCSISYLFPNAVAKPHPWFHTDIAMRNGYVGIFILIFFIISLRQPYSNLKRLILGITLFSFLFSLGSTTPIREWCYNILPLMNTFRHPATMRIFTTLGIILLACQSIDDFFKEKNSRTFYLFKYAMVIITLIVTGFVLYYFFTRSDGLLSLSTKNAKAFLDNLSFADIVIIDGILQLIFFVGLFFFIHKKRIVLTISIVNVVLFAMLSLPFSFISQTKTKEIDRYIGSFKSGFPFPSLHDSLISQDNKIFGVNFSDYDNFYNKKITIQEKVITPTLNKAYNTMLAHRSTLDSLRSMPFAFATGANGLLDSSTQITINNFSPREIVFSVKARKPQYFNLIQQFNRNWRVSVDGDKAFPEVAFTAFMKVKIPDGDHTVKFEYQPGRFLMATMWLSFFVFILLVSFVFLYPLINRFRINKKH
ncbi:MAG: YfhO family protein [Chitinophagaceae bacterium]